MELTKNILKKLHLIMSDVQRIEKDKKNEFHGYNYASEQAIKEAIHPLLVKHGVVFTVKTKNHVRTDYLNSKGNRSSLTDITVEYSFSDVETGEAITGEFVGTGDDSADKGTYKAITGAIKYIMTSTFLIPTGDDPENDRGQGGQGKKKESKVQYDKKGVVVPSTVDTNDDPFN